MTRSNSLLALAGALLLGASALPALAQDYVVTSVANQYVPPPASATINLISSVKGRDDNYFTVPASGNLPFPIFYFGKYYNSMSVCTNGFVQFGGGTSITKSSSKMPLSGADDGICAVAWDDLDGQAVGAVLTYWTDGVAPNRRFIVAWTSWEQALNTGSLSFEVQFYEGSGRIQMAYASGWSGQTRGKAVGIDAVSPDGRYVTPDGSQQYTNVPIAQPANDWRFDPRITLFSGRLLYDRYVVDSTGIGNSLEQNIPLGGTRLEVRDDKGTTVAAGYADVDGYFSVGGAALVGTDSGTLYAVSQSPACTVRPSAAAAPYATSLATNVSFGPDRDFGALLINAGTDASGAVREPFNVSRTIFGVYDWCLARASDPISAIDVYYDTASTETTAYTPAGAGAATMRVSGPAVNPDAWDTSILRKTYGRHVLASVAGSPLTAIDTTFDKATDAENAFAEGFGYYLNGAVAHEASYTDGQPGSGTTQLGMESPTILTAKGPAVTAWVAAALHDLTDAANESWDTIDGTGASAGNLYRAVASLSAAPNATSVYTAWGTLGFPGPDLARNFIHHGLIGDDADEPNDAAAESRVVPQWGFIRTARVLNLYNEDWHQFVLPAATNALTFDVIYDRLAITADVSLEVRTTAGAIIATGVYQGVAGPLRAVTGPLAPGTYRSRVVHNSGARVDSYTLQAFSELTLSADSFQPWTVGRPYNVPVDLHGGIPPYSLTVEQPFVKPPGLVLDGPNARVTGTPTAAGTYNFSLTARDVASPNNLASVPQMFVVNPELEFEFSEFTAFAMGKTLDRAAAFTGGTAPFVFATTQGALPGGITLVPGTFHLVGSPAAAGSSPFKIEGTDTAGASAASSTVGVVCVPLGTTPLASGASACGFYFDAVEGTSVSLKIGTAKKQPKRGLRVVMLANDGSTVVPANAKAGAGKATIAGFVAPSSGRFYCVIASETGEATQLTGSAKMKAPSKGAGDSGTKNFVPGSSFPVEVGALAGASLSFAAKPDGSGLQLKVQYLVDPAGNVVALGAGDVTEKNGAVSFTRVLATSGTWQVVLGAKPGPQGHFTFSFKLKQPKGVVFAAD